MNKNLLIGVIAILLVGTGFFVLTKQNSQPSAPVTKSESQPPVTEQKIRLIGTIRWLNPSDPAQYSYELTLNFPFYDKLEYTTGNEYVSKMPILSRDKILQDSIKGYVGKEVVAEGLMAWGLAESRYLEVSRITDMSSWTLYTNKTYNYSIKFPKTYEVKPGNEEQNACIRPSVGSPCEVFVNAYPNIDNLSLEDYLSKQSIAFSIDGPLIPSNFNGYDTIVNKNQPGTNVFVKQGQYIYHITASTASTDKKIGDIVATFRFTDSTSLGITKDEAVQLVKSLAEVKAYLVTVPNGIVEFDHESADKTLWVVHVYEIKNNHTATFNWFEVNKISSKIDKMF